jgi:cytochrome c-type biogenesis protein CcmH
MSSIRRTTAPGLAALLALLAIAAPSPGAAPAHASLTSIERQVMCVTCKIPLNVAESPQADRERAFIQGQIDEGRSEAQIKNALVGQYGASVLGLPSAHGFDLTVYLVPAAVALGLLGLLVIVLVRWRRAGRARAPASPGAVTLSPADAARLESDLSHFD